MNLIATKPIIEYRAMPNKIETRNLLIAEMESLMENCKIQRRSLSSKESNRFEDIRQEIAQIDIELAKEDGKASGIELRSVKTVGNTNITKEERAFVEYFQSGGAQTRDLGVSSNGVIVPKTISDMVASRVKEISPIYQRMTQLNIQGNVSIPTYDWASHTTAFITEFQAVTSSGGSFLTVDLESFPLGTLAKIGKSLINQSSLDVINVIVEQMAQSIANFLSNELINNPGLKLSGTLKTSVTQTTTGGAAGTIAPDEIITMEMLVPTQFKQGDNTGFLMHPTTFSLVKKLKDTTGNYLMISSNESLVNGFQYRLMGHPVFLDENMPELATGNRAIYFGDFSQFVCNNNSPLSATVLNELFVTEYAIGVLLTQEIDTNLMNNRAMSVYIGG